MQDPMDRARRYVNSCIQDWFFDDREELEMSKKDWRWFKAKSLDDATMLIETLLKTAPSKHIQELTEMKHVVAYLRRPRIKPTSSANSVHSLSGGLPTLGKR